MRDSVTGLLSLLADGRFHSGQVLAQALGVSRTAVWKQMETLKRNGIDIHAVRGRGYRLATRLELLEADRIRAGMPPRALRLMSVLELLGCIDSTNSHLMQRIDSLDSGHVCLCESQQRGRGRRGRRWVSPFGQNLYVSVAWHFDLPPAALAGLTLHLGMAVADALSCHGHANVKLKWPNDLYAGERKLGGILVELSGEMGGGSRIVAGLGLNVLMTRDVDGHIDQGWTSLALLDPENPPSRNRVAGQVIGAMLEALADYGAGGAGDLASRWQRYDLLAGEEVELHLPDRIVRGRAVGIDAHGGLLLRSSAGLQSYQAGEISLRTVK